MSVKESSDEPNPPLGSAGAHALQHQKPRSFKDYLALSIATCGVGYLPLAPGTWGSLLAVGVYFYASASLLGGSIDTAPVIDLTVFYIGQLIAIVLITILGVWAGSRTERLSVSKDPGKVVIDEVAGQLIALLPLPLTKGQPIMLLMAFLLFRFFDIVKPYPARKLESLHGGLGIMADDIVAGIYAAIIVAVAVVVS
jgi:phosphatidylglycerophosphatase A